MFYIHSVHGNQLFVFTLRGVDTVDKMLSCYSCKRKTNRWPMAVFSNLLDISALHALIIYKEVNPAWQRKHKNHSRRIFLRELALALAHAYMENRNRPPRSAPAASILAVISGEGSSTSVAHPEVPEKRSKSVPPQSKGRSRCYICFSEKSTKKK